jgi:hypothetical protein
MALPWVYARGVAQGLHFSEFDPCHVGVGVGMAYRSKQADARRAFGLVRTWLPGVVKEGAT